jgi:hypothetical protein
MSGNVTNIKTIPCWVEYDGEQVGYTDTPVQFTAEVVKKEISADQTGEEILLEIVQGNNLSVSFTMKEFNRTVIDKIYKDSGLASEFIDGACSDGTSTTEAACLLASETWTPATAVLGFGSANRGQNLVSLAKPLKLIPLDDAEKDNIVYIWKASPTPSGFTFSGNDEAVVECEFKAYEDSTKPAEISKAFIGDPVNLPNYVA